jgi:release factor glutamine methyltransferase
MQSNMRQFLKIITHPFLKLGLKLYYHKPRNYCYDQICIKVHPDVFPPHLTISTKILLNFIKPLDLVGKSFLELGCGSGIIALFAAKKGAVVTASDVNQKALDFLIKNAKTNNLIIETVYSDLFQNLSKSFDYIIINPPYYPKEPKNIKEKAWFCGENFEYFKKLFSQLTLFNNTNCTIYMILSQDCAIEHIIKMAEIEELKMQIIYETKQNFENNFIFVLSKL